METKSKKKAVKNIQKQIAKLKSEIKKLELRPCHGDADIRKKELEIENLRGEIYELEKEANKIEMFLSARGNGE